MILNNILVNKRKEVEELKRRFAPEQMRFAVERQVPDRRPFAKTLTAHHGIHVIAEIKKASPSAGILVESFNPLKLAELFEFAGADALSVLTERIYFLGRPSYLKTIRRTCHLPILRKDFIIDLYQLWESALYSCDAVLLIASILSEEELKQFIHQLEEFEIDPLVEVHTERDLKKALGCGAKLIGINNRNLATLEVDRNTVERLMPHVPKDATVVAESGLETHEDILKLSSFGIHIFLVGSTILRSPDPVAKIQQLKGIRPV